MKCCEPIKSNMIVATIHEDVVGRLQAGTAKIDTGIALVSQARQGPPHTHYYRRRHHHHHHHHHHHDLACIKVASLWIAVLHPRCCFTIPPPPPPPPRAGGGHPPPPPPPPPGTGGGGGGAGGDEGAGGCVCLLFGENNSELRAECDM